MKKKLIRAIEEDHAATSFSLYARWLAERELGHINCKLAAETLLLKLYQNHDKRACRHIADLALQLERLLGDES